MFRIASAGMMIRIAGLAISLASSILLARLLGPEQFGQYAFLLTVAELLTIFALFGTPALILREVAAGLATEAYGRVHGLLLWIRKTAALGSLAAMVMALAAVFLWSSRQGLDLAVITVLVTAGLIPVGAFSRQAVNTVQGMGRIVAAQALSIILGPVIFLGILLVVWLALPGTLDLRQVLFLLLFSRLVAWLVLEIEKKRDLPPKVLSAQPIYLSEEWFKSTLPLLLVGSLLIINTRIDIIMLGYLRDSTEVGIYRVAQRGGQLMLFGVMAVDSIINPLAASAWAKGEKNRLQKVVSRSIPLVLMFTLPLFGAYMFAGQPLINFVYGTAYRTSWLPLVILSGGYLSMAFLGRGGVILTMSHFERHTSLAIGVGVVANIFLNLLLIPRYGVTGAAIATALAVTLRMVMESLLAYRKTGINTTIFARLSANAL